MTDHGNLSEKAVVGEPLKRAPDVVFELSPSTPPYEC